jgi:hypothetical protein
LELDDEDAVCVICLNHYEDCDKLRTLPCTHHFHFRCVDEWLRLNKRCPLCVRDVTLYYGGPSVELRPLDGDWVV